MLPPKRSWMTSRAIVVVVVLLLLVVGRASSMRCSYGERGSLTATCVNATASFFRASTYRFDNLDETVVCATCDLGAIESNTFDIAGNLIKNLVLTNAQITQLKASSFVGLVFLENLQLNRNKIAELTAGTFRGIKKLLALDLSHNLIATIRNESFRELINLSRLNCESNAIETIESGALVGLVALRWLNLRDNKIHAIVPELFAPLIAIETINLDDNALTVVHPGDVNCSTLLELSMSKNSLRAIDADSFKLLHDLRLLDLSWNAIDTLREGAFNGLRMLTQLDLDGNRIERVERTIFAGLHALSYLHLSANKIVEFKSGTFSGLPELRALNVSFNRIRAVESTGVFRLNSLHTLDLSRNLINDVDYKLLAYTVPKLSHFAIVANKLPCYLIGEMRAFFGNDSIVLDVDEYDAGACKLTNPALRKNATVDLAASIAKEFINDDVQGVHNGVTYTLFTILLLLIAVLFFAQYRFYRVLNDAGIRTLDTRTVSRSQLVSDEFENNHDGEMYNNK